MKKSGGINLLFVAALALIILAGTGAAASLSNSGGGKWNYQRNIINKENNIELVRGDINGRNDSKAAKRH